MLVYGNKLGLPTIVSRFLRMHNSVNGKKAGKAQGPSRFHSLTDYYSE